MVFHKQVAGVIPGMMSLALVGKSAKLVNNSFKSKTKDSDFVKESVGLLIALPLLGAVAGSVVKL